MAGGTTSTRRAGTAFVRKKQIPAFSQLRDPRKKCTRPETIAPDKRSPVSSAGVSAASFGPKRPVKGVGGSVVGRPWPTYQTIQLRSRSRFGPHRANYLNGTTVSIAEFAVGSIIFLPPPKKSKISWKSAGNTPLVMWVATIWAPEQAVPDRSSPINRRPVRPVRAAEKGQRSRRAVLDNRRSTTPRRCDSAADKWPRC